MATQGMVCVVSSGAVVMKVIAGSDGYNASKLANWLKVHPEANIDEVYEYALSINFGSRLSLVVQTTPEIFRIDVDCEELSHLYKSKFNDPKFNPRWENGTAEYLEIVER